ncbi:MAG: GNAT family N-acetyltransferase [Primorskyibacter sp.]
MTAQDHAGPQTTFRAATQADIPEITDVLRAAYAPYADVPGLPDMTADVAGDFAQTQRPTQARVAQSGTGRIVGLVMWRGPIAGDPHAHIMQLAVHPDMAGQGLGRGLLDQVTQAAKAAGASYLTLSTHRAMTAALALYARLGWRKEDHPHSPTDVRVSLRKPLI